MLPSSTLILIIALELNLALASSVPVPASQTNQSLYFPTESTLGYAGPTQYGAEPSLIENAVQPMLNSHFPILDFNSDHPLHQTQQTNQTERVDSNEVSRPPIYEWGNLSPMYSLPPQTFSIQHGPGILGGCKVEQVHLVHRHGARYPTGGTSLPAFGRRIQAAQTNHQLHAKGALEFLNQWNYQLGAEVLTPFGRSQMFQLGVSYRQRYGSLLEKMAGRLPVFRTTTQDRMYKSAINFAAGFFGIPSDNEYHQSILIENKGFNNSLAPYYVCPNSVKPGIGDLGSKISDKWVDIYLQPAVQRLNKLVEPFKFNTSDLYTMQQLCSYETVAFGTSKFCTLFTQKEWLDYAYANDLNFWYSFSFGNPTSAALGLGYAQELLARLSGQRLPLSTSSVNTTLYNNPHTFPLDQSIYVDATHDIVLSSIVVALNLTSLASGGPLPTQHRDPHRSFRVEQIAPFGAQIATQVLSCPVNGTSQNFVRIILNDAVVPLNGLGNCGSDQKWGLCRIENFISSLKIRVNEIDFKKACFGKYNYRISSSGGGITNGRIL
ncbi:hypothetical protein CROQUDRAFT_660242 [Cronartium quercuum f. sp. fusiforme G11]|uniref:Phosphoglycerate mutase-like protein n=1 Tax=Cronartium quercuum f. sp. fusiforme G11 TaxID=708437 RepID=A0A9P6NHL7_9BASI|nr:hypothetical protein CROQUDRAFT_660242 [Cronartium quercuum f. sp. fusiforme G11]